MITTTNNELNQSCADCISDAVCARSRSECVKHEGFIRKSVAKEAAHTSPPDHPFPQYFSCEGCIYLDSRGFPPECNGCCYSRIMKSERKNYTPYDKVHGIDCLFDESKDCKTCEANPNIKPAPAPAPKFVKCDDCSRNGYSCTHQEIPKAMGCEAGIRGPTSAAKAAQQETIHTSILKSIVNLCDDLGKDHSQTIQDFIGSLAQRAGEGFTVEEIADAVVKHCHPYFCTTSEIADFIREWKGEK